MLEDMSVGIMDLRNVTFKVCVSAADGGKNSLKLGLRSLFLCGFSCLIQLNGCEINVSPSKNELSQIEALDQN